MDVREFDFELPPELIAQEPTADRTAARLLFLDRPSGDIAHTSVAALPTLLHAGDLLVVNNSRVFPARLLGRRTPSGGAVECLLVRRVDPLSPRESSAKASAERSQVWEALMHPGQKLKPGAEVVFEGTHALHGVVLERHFFGRRIVRLWTDDGSDVTVAVDAIGHVPLPPYIKRDDDRIDRDRYQTVYARDRGSVAAPTAGLHFTPELLAALTAAGVGIAEITLHVGYGTFQPVRVTRVEDHRLDAERYTIGDAAATAITR